MRTMLLALAISFSPTLLSAQQAPEWYRVYTFADSFIDLNTTEVTFTGKSTGRVRFRWSFDKPGAMSGEPRIKFRSRLEVIEFDCSDQRYRPSQVTLLDASGKIIRSEERYPPGEWKYVTYGSMLEKLYAPACQLIKIRRSGPRTVFKEHVETEKAERFARLFSQRLEKKKDFAPLVKEFFAPDYLAGYLRDQETKWFSNLNPDVAATVSRAELQRYYVALLNVGYLGSLYFVSQSPATSDESVSDEKNFPHRHCQSH